MVLVLGPRLTSRSPLIIFTRVYERVSEGVGMNDGPFFSNNFCGVVKGIIDKLIAFSSVKLLFMSMVLCLQLCLYLFLFSVKFRWLFRFENRLLLFVIVSELFSYLLLSLINFRLCFFLIDLSNVSNLFLMVAKDLL